MNEIWKDVVGYEGHYQVSNLGRVKSVARVVKINGKNQHGECFSTKYVAEKFLKPVDYGGYRCVSLYKEHKMKLSKVHRLVATAFLGPSDLTVNHIDGNKSNNALSNLEYMTSGDNTRHAIRTGLRDSRGESNPRHKLTEREVIDIRTRQLNGESREQVFGLYANKISHVTFEKIWYKMSWKNVIV